MISALNQTMVSHALFSFNTSSHVNTPVSNNSTKPNKAVVVGSTAQALPKIMAGTPAHSNSSTAKIVSMMRSPRLISPISASFSLANCAAFGVFLISGG